MVVAVVDNPSAVPEHSILLGVDILVGIVDLEEDMLVAVDTEVGLEMMEVLACMRLGERWVHFDWVP